MLCNTNKARTALNLHQGPTTQHPSINRGTLGCVSGSPYLSVVPPWPTSHPPTKCHQFANAY